MNKRYDKLLEDLKKETNAMSPEEFQEAFGYKPNEYHLAAIAFQEKLIEDGKKAGIDSFSFPEAMTYVVGDMFKEPLKEVKKIALELIEKGHTTFENEYDYEYADQYSHAFYENDKLCFVKRDQSFNYVIVFEEDTRMNTGDIHIRTYWEEMNKYYQDDLDELTDKIQKGDTSLKTLNEIGGIVKMFSDSSYEKDYPKRPNLHNVLNGVGMFYCDGRDKGYIGSFKQCNYSDTITISNGYNINVLSHIVYDMQSSIHE